MKALLVLVSLLGSLSAFSAEKTLALAADATNIRVGHPYIANVVTHYDDSQCVSYSDGACFPVAVYETKVVVIVDYNSRIEAAQKLNNDNAGTSSGEVYFPGSVSDGESAMETQVLFDLSDFSAAQIAMIRGNAKAESVLLVKSETSTYPSTALDQDNSTFCSAGGEYATDPANCQDVLVSKPVQASNVFVTISTL